jgi:hypothetical protein
MPDLPRFSLSHDQQKDNWKLTNAVGRVVRRFDTKADATTGGVLFDAIGSAGGPVRVEKAHGGFQEERTFPRSADPKKSPG